MSYNFKNKQILITGASSGIGLEFAKQFHALGANLILLARRREILEKVAAAFNQSRAASARVLQADLADQSSNPGGLESVCQFIRENAIDILVNNAGIGSFGYFESIDAAQEINILNLNVYAPLKLLQAAIPQMKARKSGAIISLSSVAGIQPIPFMATYAASKAFNLFHTLALRQELTDFGIRALTVCPGPTETEFFGVARVPGKATDIRRDRVEDVVCESINALRKNKAYVVTGWRAKLMVCSSRIVPIKLSTWLVKKAVKSSLPE